jgi:murein DD-endopeptidase MepM/ murein hydrolase activator NlpD
VKPSIWKLTLMGAVLALSSTAQAGTLFRLPLSMNPGQCTVSNGVGGCVVSAYYDLNRSSGAIRDWVCKSWTYDQHNAVDIAIVGDWSAMDAGRWVMSAAGGTFIGTHDGEYDRCSSTSPCSISAANYMILKHSDGRQSKYWHLKKWSLLYSTNQSVACGNYIAKVGSSGASTKPHLHFGFWDPVWGTDDSFAAIQGCGGTISLWTNQGPYRGLPGNACQ